jgi:arylsulfatase A-like enzyme
VAFALVFFGGCRCGEEHPNPVAAASPTPSAPNILLIVVDTLRADHVGVYGRSPSITPNMDALAERGTRFDRCSAAASTTLASITSVLTGTYPHTHGIYRNGIAWPDGVAGVQSVFGAAGYETAGFVSSRALHQRFGIAQGFDQYRTPKTPRQRRSPRAIGEIEDWLESREGGRPFFGFLHLFDPHYPYEPPPPFDTRFDPEYSGMMTGTRKDLNRLREALLDDVPGAERDARHVEALYAGEVAYLDEQLGGLWETLDRNGLWENTVVVLTSDHGETFTEHQTRPFEHGFSVYNTEVHVPLIIVGPTVPAGRTVAAPISNIDITPTLLELANLDPWKPVEGWSLRPLFVDGAQEPFEERPHFMEATRPNRRPKNLWSPNRGPAPPPARRPKRWPNERHPRGVVQGDIKVQHWPRSKNRIRGWELYDVGADPQETEDRWADPALQLGRKDLIGTLNRWSSQGNIRVGTETTDPEAIEQLKALGYLE